MISAQKVKGSNPFGRTRVMLKIKDGVNLGNVIFVIIVKINISMKLVFKSNNLVEISWVKYILDTNDIEFFVLDELMSINEGNISAIPIRILVKDSFVNKAKKLLNDELKKL